MHWLDLSILIIIVLSIALSFFQGLVKEVLSLMVWLLSIIIALVFGLQFSQVLNTVISFPDLRLLLASLGLFTLTFTLGSVINFLIIRSLRLGEGNLAERMVSVLCGGVRGLVIVIGLMFLAGLTRIPSTRWWQEALLIQEFQPVVSTIRSQLPAQSAAAFNFESLPKRR